MQAPELVRLIQRLGAPAAMLTEAEVADCHRLAHVLRVTTEHDWQRIVSHRPEEPTLLVYMSDEWAGDVRSCTTNKIAGSHLVLRRGQLRHEFLLQRGIIRKSFADGTEIVSMKLAEPLGLGLGRGAWNMVQAGCDFMATARSMGARGITITAYLFDGKPFKSLRGHFAARHDLFYCKELGFDHGPMHLELQAMGWVLPVKCIAHACSNSVSWGLKPIGLDEYKENVHISIASLVNARTALHASVGLFVETHLKFKAERSGELLDIECFWRALHIEPHMCEVLCDLDFFWDGCSLSVHASWERKSHTFSTVTACVLFLFRWCSFSETRWAKVGLSGRYYLSSVAGGIDRVWRICMSDSTISKYHLSGYAKADVGVKRLLAIASFSALPAESLLLDIFEDDRWLKRSKELWETANSEIVYLTEIVSPYVWQRIAGMLDIGLSGVQLRAEVLGAAHITLSFVWQDSADSSV